jgi:hypothetical protein
LRWAGFFKPGDLRPGLEVLGFEPAQVHLKRITGRLCAAVAVFGLRLHVLDIEDDSCIIDKRDRERQKRVLHPHALLVAIREHEQHALIGRHLFALHQSLHARPVVRGDFRLDQVKTDLQLHGWQRRLALRLGA